jgi:hypothetical protein
MVAVVMAALRSGQGGESMAQELSLDYVANDIAQTSHGMMIALPEDEWRVFSRMRPAERVAPLRELAQQARLKAYRKSFRGPKQHQPKREGTTKSSHVSTAKILRNRKVNAATPEQGCPRDLDDLVDAVAVSMLSKHQRPDLLRAIFKHAQLDL